MYFLMGLYFIVANFAHPITPTFIQNLGLNDYMFGVAFAAMALTNFLFSPFWGKLASNIGSTRIISFGFIGYAIAQGIFGLATTEAGIVVGRLLAGLFNGAIIVNQMIYIMDNSTLENRGRNLAISATITSVVSPFGYLIGGVLGDYSIPLTFTIQVIGLFIVGIINWLVLDDKPIKDKQPLKQLAKDSNPVRIVIDAKSLLTPVLISFFVVAIATSFASISYDQSFNYFIKDQYGFPPSYNGFLKAIVGFITLIANSTICMWLLRKTDINKSIIYVLSICLAMMIAIVMINDIVPFIIINVIFFGFNAVYLPLMQSILAKFNRTEGSGGVLVGMFNSMRSFGMVFGSLFAGFIYTVGPKLAFVFSGVAFFISVVFAYICYVQISKERKLVND